MKRIIAIVFLMNLSVVSIYNLWQWTSFILNQEKIAAELCINKNKPEISCNGKCQLAKQLEKEEKQSNTPVSCKKINVVLFFSEVKTTTKQDTSLEIIFYPHSSKLLNGHSKKLSPPPKV
jgi:hypothetical protein